MSCLGHGETLCDFCGGDGWVVDDEEHPDNFGRRVCCACDGEGAHECPGCNDCSDLPRWPAELGGEGGYA